MTTKKNLSLTFLVIFALLILSSCAEVQNNDHTKNPRVVTYKGGTKQIVTPIKGGYSNNAACVGSGTVSYGAMAWRFMEEDFKLKTVYGHVEGSTLEDWPITYVSDDPVQKLCIQCHSPNFAHQAGSEDDRTPTGAHEGLSCMACHSPHSNDARNSCIKCHPGISNCKIDVTVMNTTYADINSPNNIHSVSCNSCHIDKK